MNKRVIFGIAAIALIASPAWAIPSADWPMIEAEVKALPQSGVPQQVLDEIHNKILLPAGVPAAWAIIKINTEDGLASREDWKRNDDGTVNQTIIDFCCSTFRTLDGSGLVPISRHVLGPVRLAALAISRPIDVSASSVTSAAKLHTLGYDTVGTWSDVMIIDDDWQITGTPQALTLSESDSSRHSHSGSIGDDGAHYTNTATRHYKFDFRFGVFSSIDENIELVDWKIENQPWHSLAVSAGLTAAQKAQARVLFARGFDLYKSGDLIGARALVESGLKIDPGNYLGWFTLAEIGRSTVAQNPDGWANHWARSAERVYYQHTMDLAPDSPEATLAKGYLAALK